MQAFELEGGEAKSRRATAKEINRSAIDILVGGGDDSTVPPRHSHCGIGEWFFMIAQIITVILIAVGCEYGTGVQEDGSNNGSGAAINSPGPTAASGFDPNKDFVQRLYPVFQDVHVMIFIGFGFLMTFIKTSSWSALAFNWIISAWALEWGILSTGFWHQLVGSHGEGGLHKIQIDLTSLIAGDFAAGAAMITFGAILGKCNLQQLFFLVWWEMIWYGLNEAICFNIFHVSDAGGSILVHTFGAYFGVAATYGFQPKRSSTSINMQSNYQSEMVAVVGSIFLWMYWPSFNGALAEGTTQHRIMVNTTLAIVGSVLSACMVSRILFGKLDMEIVLNATLAGGVAVGSSCDMVCEPWAAIAIGMAGGILSALGFAKIGPWLANSKLALQDTCGVHSLHGMPGVFAAIVSMIYLCTLEGKKEFPKSYFTITNPDTSKEGGGLGLTYNDQAIAQLKSLLVTLAFAITSGLSGGFMCSLDIWKPVHALFRDDDHFHHVLSKYPKHYLEVSDEAVEYAKEAMYEIQNILARIMPGDQQTNDQKMEWMTENIYLKFVNHEKELNKSETLNFINDFLAENHDEDNAGDFTMEGLMPGKVFDSIFAMLDDSKNGRVSKDEILGYFIKLNSGAARPASAGGDTKVNDGIN